MQSVKYDELKLPNNGQVLLDVEYDVEGVDWEPYDPGVWRRPDGSGDPPSGGYWNSVKVSNVRVGGKPRSDLAFIAQLEEWAVNDEMLMGNLNEERMCRD